jgi:hypothetical protein
MPSHAPGPSTVTRLSALAREYSLAISRRTSKRLRSEISESGASITGFGLWR